MRILLAIDSSAPSMIAVDEVARRPWPKGTTLRILHVFEKGPLWESLYIGGGDVAALTEKAREAAGRLVEEAAQRVGGAISTSTDVIQGHPRIEIPDYATKRAADLLIVGSHGRSGVSRVLLGSVALTVMRRAPCSVQIVRPRAGADSGGMRILLATDGSPCSLAAAQSVAARPWPRGSQIRIIGVAESAAHVVEPWYFDREIMQSVIDQQIKEAKLSVASAQEIIQDSANLTSSTTVPLGVATGAILEEADNWKADLIVLGSHGRHGLGRLLIGSVSESVAIHARCSVEVVRKKTNED